MKKINKKNNTRVITILLCILLIATMFTSATLGGESNEDGPNEEIDVLTSNDNPCSYKKLGQTEIQDDGTSTFGYTIEGTRNINIENRIVGVWGEAVDGDGKADYIMAFFKAVCGYGDYIGNATAGLYEYVDSSSTFAGALLGQTEVKALNIGEGTLTWIKFDFIGEKPTIINNTKYYCVLSAENTVGNNSGNLKIMGTKESGYGMWQIKKYNDILPDLLEDEVVSEYRRSIYCSYTITPENIPPIAVNDSAFMTEAEKAIKIDVADNDNDPDGELDLTTVSIVKAPTQGTVSVDKVTGIVVYARNNNFIGPDNFTYTINDTEGAKSNIATVTINSIQENNPPVAENDYAKTDEDNEVIIDVLENDSDIDGDPIKIVDVSEPGHGKAEIITNPSETSNKFNQKIRYIPNLDYNGEDEFKYTISDGHGGKDIAIVYINIAPVNDPPYIPSNPNPQEGETNVDINVDLSWTGGDPEGDNVTYDVHFGTTSSFSSKISGNQKAETYDPGTLDYSTIYYWKIVAWDKNSESTEGPIWNFITENAPNNGGNPSEGGSSDNVGGETHTASPSPVADASAGEPYHGFVDEEITFDGSASYVTNGEITSWHWSFGDGTFGNGEIVNHSYSSPRAYLVTLTVTDDKYETDTDITTATIIQPNRPPSEPVIYGLNTCVKDEKYSYVAISTDEDGDHIKYFFDWGDGSMDESEFSPSQDIFAGHFIHRWESTGTYTVTVTVSDNKTTSSSEMSVEVIAPSVDYTVIIILGIIIAVSVIISLILVKTGKAPKFGKK